MIARENTPSVSKIFIWPSNLIRAFSSLSSFWIRKGTVMSVWPWICFLIGSFVMRFGWLFGTDSFYVGK